ncbi:unnamed protein product [Rotaria sordida]|uniref:Uncharacterized protein n=1 Tax=Rotaria sordida TaxID=392033 RepID=A0A819VG51_9BILA|nr:unnamed protein product [Rotaria sordida]
MSNSKEPLALYILAVRQKRHNDAVQVLTDVINTTTNKNDLLEYLQSRIESAYCDENYNQILKDCKELQDLGFNFDENKQLLLILFEAKYRVGSQKTIEELKQTATKSNDDINVHLNAIRYRRRILIPVIEILTKINNDSSNGL